MSYESFVKIKRDYLQSISVKNNSVSNLDYTFINQNLPRKLYIQIGIKSKIYFNTYFTAKKYIKPTLMKLDFFSNDDLYKENKNKTNDDQVGFIKNLVKKLIVALINFILGNYFTRKILYMLYPRLSSFPLTKRIIKIYKNNIS